MWLCTQAARLCSNSPPTHRGHTRTAAPHPVEARASRHATLCGMEGTIYFTFAFQVYSYSEHRIARLTDLHVARATMACAAWADKVPSTAQLEQATEGWALRWGPRCCRRVRQSRGSDQGFLVACTVTVAEQRYLLKGVGVPGHWRGFAARAATAPMANSAQPLTGCAGLRSSRIAPGGGWGCRCSFAVGQTVNFLPWCVSSFWHHVEIFSPSFFCALPARNCTP